MRSSTVPRPFRPAFRLLILTAWALGLLSPCEVRAHFLWLTSDRDGGGPSPSVRAFLSETPTPEGPEFLKHIAKARVTAGGRTLSWTAGEDTYRVNLPDPYPEVVDGFCDLGVMKRGETAFRLIYTARIQFGPSTGREDEAADHLRLRLVARPGSPAFVAVTFRGKPAAGAVIKAFPEGGDPVELKADAQGRLEYLPAAEGRAGLLAKWSVKEGGRDAGIAYDETRYYATLTVGPALPKPSKAGDGPAATTAFATLPQAVDSFGGAVLGDWLYVYGGHTGKMHKYSRETASKHFRRLSLPDRRTWEELPAGPALQGVTLMAHGGRLYRIGGMAPHNPPGEPADLVSVADFARFDPATKTWTDLRPLPSPRSTHDSVVVGDRIFVIGGWSMNGGDSANAEFLDTALAFDLSRPGDGWEELPAPPSRRRALAVGAIGGKVYALGGLTEGGKVVRSVDLYDPASRTWSRGPDLPGGNRQGFAPSAFGVDGRLYATGADGQVFRLVEAGDRWEAVGKLATPRVAHRLLPGIADDLLAVGGSSAGSPVALIESIPLGGAGPRAARP